MKFTAPPLSSEKRASFERIKEWCTGRVRALETLKTRLDELTSAFATADSRKNQLARDASLNAEAALQLSGVETQLLRLGPDVKSARRTLENATADAIRQINLLRAGDVRELLFGPLLDQLVASVATAISPFFAAGWARHQARQLVQYNCPQYRELMAYLNPPPIATIEFEAAKREINVFAVELGKILAGETLIEA